MSYPDSHGESMDMSDPGASTWIEKCLVIGSVYFLFLLVVIIKAIQLHTKAELRANKLQIALTTTQVLLNEQNAANSELLFEQTDLKNKIIEEKSNVREKEVTIQLSNRLLDDCLNELHRTESLLTQKCNIISYMKSKESATNSKLEESERKLGEVQTSLREMQDAYTEKRDAFSQLQVQLNERTRELLQQSRRILYIESRERETNSKLQESERKLGEAKTSLTWMQDAYSEIDLRELERNTQLQELKQKLIETKTLLHQKEAALISSSEIAEKVLCGICYSAEKKCALKCGHMLCDGCFQRIRSQNNRCPQCRTTIRSVNKIYF